MPTIQAHSPREREPLGLNTALVLSVVAHILALLAVGGFALLKPHRPSEIPVFEIVNLEPPKLRPLRPKAIPPPEPPPPEPEPVKAPDAPKLTTKAVTKPPTKKEPKVVKPPDEEKLPEKETVVPQENMQPNIVAHVPQDARLSMWAQRVKKKAETLWNPPTGMDIVGAVKAIVDFKVIRDGTVQDASVSTSTGNPDLDALALRTIQRMEHVPPIPENFPDDVVQVSYEFIYKAQ